MASAASIRYLRNILVQLRAERAQIELDCSHNLQSCQHARAVAHIDAATTSVGNAIEQLQQEERTLT